MNLKKMFLLEFFLTAVILISSVYGFDISSPSSSQIGYSSSSLNFDLNGILFWTYELIADFFGVPIEDMQIRGGNLFAFVIVPILLAYMMFYGIIKKLNLFDENWINTWIPLLLALMLAPLGAYRRFFFAMTGFFTTGTATLLYIFLFVAMLGYGYRYMFASGVGDFTAGSMYIKDMKDAKNGSKKLIKQIEDITEEIARLNTKIESLGEGDENKIQKLKNKKEALIKHRNILELHLTNRNSEIIKGLKNIISTS